MTQPIELIDLDNDDDVILDCPSIAVPPTVRITSQVKKNTKNLWKKTVANGKRSNGELDGKKNSAQLKECKSDATVSSSPAVMVADSSAASSDEQGTSTDASSSSAPERNLFDVFTQGESIETATLNGSNSNSSSDTAPNPRKRPRTEDGTANGDVQETMDVGTYRLGDLRQALHDRAASKLNGQCDCDKKSRAMEEQVTNLKGQLTELYSQYSQLAEEHKAFAAKLDQAAQVERRTVAVQVNMMKTSTAAPATTQQRHEITIGNSLPASTPKTGASMPPMPNLVRYPSPQSSGPPATSIRAPAAPPMAAMNATLTPPARVPTAVFVSAAAGTPSRLPLQAAVPVRTIAPVTQAQRLVNTAVGQVTVVSSTGAATKGILTPSGVVASQPAATITTAASHSALPQTSKAAPPPSASVRALEKALSALASSNHSATTPKPIAPTSSVSKTIGQQPANATPPRLTRAPNGTSGPGLAIRNATAPSDARVLIRTPAARPAGPPPHAAVRPSIAQPRLQQPRPIQSPTVGSSLSYTIELSPRTSSPFPALPSLRSHVPPHELNAASAIMRPPPPKPQLSVSKESGRVTLLWDMPSLSNVDIKEYRIYSYKAHSGEPWVIVGGVEPLPLPMACTLTSCVQGHQYYFAITAEDRFGRFGPFSDVCSIMM